MNPPTPFDWPKWLDHLWYILREAADSDFSTTLLPLFKSAPRPSPNEKMILVNASNCWDDDMQEFLFSVASRDPDDWPDLFEWGQPETNNALQHLEREMNRPPMREFFDIPPEAADLFDRFKTSRDQALTLFHPLAFQFDGDKAIRTRVAKFLITPPVKCRQLDEMYIKIDGKRFWLVDDDERDEFLEFEAKMKTEGQELDLSDDSSDESSDDEF